MVDVGITEEGPEIEAGAVDEESIGDVPSREEEVDVPIPADTNDDASGIEVVRVPICCVVGDDANVVISMICVGDSDTGEDWPLNED